MRAGVCCAVFLVFSGPALAACPGETQMEMNQCAADGYAAADAELNHAWGVAKRYMDGFGAGDALLDAQRKWISYRDAACMAEAAQHEGGSIQPLIWFTCLETLTERRTADLLGLVIE